MLTVTLFSIVLNNMLLCATGDMNQKDFMKREHSLIKPYNGKITYVSDKWCYMKNKVMVDTLLFVSCADDRWDFYGSTMVTNNFVRLTPDQRSKSGQIWNKIVSKINSVADRSALFYGSFTFIFFNCLSVCV